MSNLTVQYAAVDAQFRSVGESYRPLGTEWANRSIPELFQKQVEKWPERLAISTKHGAFTYQALDAFSNRIANSIKRRGQAGRNAVCILLEHDALVPAAIFGILKTGNFYVALDSNYPRERNEFLVRDSEATLIVTNDRNKTIAESLIGGNHRLINIDDLRTDAADGAPEVHIGPNDIAYLVYTSGSTGEPKGVVHTHRSSLHSTMRQVSGWRLCSGDRIGLFFTYNFGPSAVNLFGAVLSGACLYPFDIKNEPPGRLLKWLRDEKISFFHTVPTFFRHLVSIMDGGEHFPMLRLVRLAGETIYGKDVRQFQQYMGKDCVLQVGLGSSETGAVLQNYYDYESVCADGVISPGYATEDMHVLLLNESGDEVGPGEVGEIVVRSRYLFKGYWNRPRLTSQVLMSDPNGSDEYLFFMRDLGSRLPDGRIMHLGRKDAQLKIRGHRVEIGEIECALTRVPGIAKAAVVTTDSGAEKKQLIAYVVRDNNASMPTSSLSNLLKQSLPEYMIPTKFIPLDELPLTVSGKVDRAELIARPLSSKERAFLAPRDHLETQLLAVWEELLQTRGFGIRDDFFELGGDSLLAMRMTLCIEELYGRIVNLANFPTEITIEVLADVLEASEHDNLQRPILEIQKGGTEPPLFFFHGDYISGGVFCRNLARHLGPEQPFYAIPPHGLDGAALPPTIEAMAADRVKALLEFQPDGPYRLGGFCWGGIVALEMARQIQVQGGYVEALLVIDSDPKYVRLKSARKLIRYLRMLLFLSQDTELLWFGRCRQVYDAWSRAEGDFYDKCKILIAKLPNFISRYYQSRGAGRLPISPEVPADRHARFSTFSAINRNYVAGPYSGHVALFRSSRLRERYPDDPKANWRHITAEIKTYSIEGDHWTCVTKHADDVARKINAYLSSRTTVS